MEELDIPTEVAPTTPSLLNKKPAELTVGDNLKLMVLMPIVTIGSIAAAGAAITGVSALASKIRNRKGRKNAKVEEVAEPVVETTTKSK